MLDQNLEFLLRPAGRADRVLFEQRSSLNLFPTLVRKRLGTARCYGDNYENRVWV